MTPSSFLRRAIVLIGILMTAAGSAPMTAATSTSAERIAVRDAVWRLDRQLRQRLAAASRGRVVLGENDPKPDQLAELLRLLRDSGRKLGDEGRVLAAKANALEPLLDEVERRERASETTNFPASAWEPTIAGTPLNLTQRETCADAPSVTEGQFAAAVPRQTEGVGPSLWLRYTPTRSGVVVLSTAGSDFDTQVEVYGTCPGLGTAPIARADDEVGLQARASFRAAAGETFWMRVAGVEGASGVAAIHLEGGQAGIQGIVIDEAAGQAVSGGEVEVWGANGLYVASGYVDSEGSYLVGLSPGTYFASTALDTWDGLLDELYDDLPCAGGAPQGCSPGTGTPIAVPDGMVVDGIDFALGHGAAIAGRVRDAVTGAPLKNASVTVYGAAGQQIRYAVTDEVGRFLATGLPSGVVYAVAEASYGYRRELYQDISCVPNCNPRTGTPISVANGQTTPGVDFALEHLGAIGGTVTRLANGAPVSYAYVSVRTAQGAVVSSAYTDGSGAYLAGGLEAGSYFVSTQTRGAYVDELYDDLPCEPSCDTSTGTPVPVTLGNTTPGIDFALRRMATISGRLSDAVTGDPIYSYFYYGASITLFDAAGVSLGSQYAYGDQYQVSGLPAGTYYLKASHSDYRGEVYDDLPCPGSCDPTTGTAITVGLDGDATGIDFALTPLGRIAGTVTDEDARTPIRATVQVWSSTGQLVREVTTYSGTYRISGLADGNYFVTAADALYAGELYEDLPCPGGPPSGCIPTTGKSVPAAMGITTSGIDFALARKGKIAGTVRSASTSQPISWAQVWVFNSSGAQVALTYANYDGQYEVDGLDAGSYFVVADAQSNGYDAEVYDDLPCPDAACNPAIGTPVAVTTGTATAGIDFELSLSRVITGVVTRPDGGAVSGIDINLYDASGQYRAYTSTDWQGRYQLPAEPGTWFVLAYGYYQLMNQLYSGIPCPGWSCSVTSGTPVVVTRGADTADVDFALVYARGISGKVSDAGHPLAGVAIDLWNAAGVHVGSTVTAQNGTYHLDYGSGHYFVSTDSGMGAIEELWDNIPCPLGPAYQGLCDPTTGTPVVVATEDSAVSGIDFALDGVELFGNGFETGNLPWSAWTP